MAFHKVGIIGAGTMGAGIAHNVAVHGIGAHIVDKDQAALDRAIAGIGKSLQKQVDKGKMTADNMALAMNRLIGSTAIGDLAEEELVIEAVFEDIAVKRSVLGELDKTVSKTCLIATNTSSLKVSDLAQLVSNPDRFAGLHYFNPAAVNPFIEVIKGTRTEKSVIDRLLEFCDATGKEPIVCKDSNGFAVNRFFVPYGNEAARLLEEGVGTAGQIDAAAREAWRVAAGPMLVMNVVKPVIMLNAQNYLRPFGAFYEPCALLKTQGESNTPFAIEEAADGGPRAAEIIDRLRAAACFPVLQALDEEVAEAEDFDMGAEIALKFGVGPCKMMDDLGADAVKRLLAPLLARYGAAAPASLARVGQLRAG